MFIVCVICTFMWFYICQCVVVHLCICLCENVCVYVRPTERNWGSAPRHRQYQETTTNQPSTHSWSSLSAYFCFAAPGFFKLHPLSEWQTGLLPLDCHPKPTKPWVASAVPTLAGLCSSTGRDQKAAQPQRDCVHLLLASPGLLPIPERGV